MSLSNFQKGFSNRVIDKLEVEARREVEKQSGQVLILPGPKEIRKAIQDTFGDQDLGIKEGTITTAIAKARDKALDFQNIYKRKNQARFNTIVARFDEVIPSQRVQLGVNAFVVTSFRYSINQVKKVLLDHIQSQSKMSADRRKELSKNIHKGHGVRGSAVSQVEIAQGLAGITPEQESDLLNNFQAYSKKVVPRNVRKEITKLITKHRQIVTKAGKLQDDYFSIVEFQLGKENIGIDASYEKLVKNTFREFIEKEYSDKLINERGSSSLKEKVETVIVDGVVGKKPKKVKRSKKANLKTTHKATAKGTKSRASGTVTAGATVRKRRARKGVSSSPLKMIAAINAQLPSVLQANMQSPALNYRTGRFASSVRVLDAAQTAKGFTSFSYTYQKYPYQTFEPGFAQGSVERDPRKLIDKSIREIATQFAMGRFYTRRV